MSKLPLALNPNIVNGIFYPETDGLPMAENTLQFEWIVTIEGGLEAVFKEDPNVFVAGDLLWYPVEGEPSVCAAPDAMVVFGRPKGHRRSYQQWKEGGIGPQVVFEVVSPSNTVMEMLQKGNFYSRFGVQEYYVYDPELKVLLGYERKNNVLQEIPLMSGWTSPLLQVRFRLGQEGLELFGPDGKPFHTFVEVVEQRDTALQLNRRYEERLRELGVDPDGI